MVESAVGSLIVVSAPSGAGKSTLTRRVLDRIGGLKFSVSYTTRLPRTGEVNGADYCFVDRLEFQAMRERGEFLENAEVHGNLYGTHRGFVESVIREGADVILDIDVQGAEQIRSAMPDSVSVFVLPPSREVLEGRLQGRNLNSPDDIANRLVNAEREVRCYRDFDYVIVNDDLDAATAALEAIVRAERQRLKRQDRLARQIISRFGGEGTDG